MNVSRSLLAMARSVTLPTAILRGHEALSLIVTRQIHAVMVGLLAILIGLFTSSPLAAQELHELPLEEWKKLREVERYQMQVADKYWQEQNWSTAAGEYEKFIELYETSNGAPYAQLRWSLALVRMRQQNTAIKDGFQTVIDYWPDSDQAIAAAFYLGRTQREIGRLKEAKVSLKQVVAKYPEHLAAVHALNELIEIAAIEKDTPGRVEAWKRLTFDIPRNRYNSGLCVQASQQLAAHFFREAAFNEGVRSLETTFKQPQLSGQVLQAVRSPIYDLCGQSESKAKGDSLATQAIAWFNQQVPTDRASEEGKQAARQNLLAVADLLTVARRDEQVPGAYENVLKNASPDDEALGRLASWYKSKQMYDQARSTFRRYQNKAEGEGQVAYSFREQQNWTAAAEAYRNLMNQDATQIAKWKSELAMTLRAAGKWQEAIAEYEGLLTIDGAKANQWRWEIASTHRDAGQFKEAIGHFRQCENFPENYKQMAQCHRRLKQPAEAILLYNQVASDKGSAPWAMLQIAYTREEAGEQERAIQAFQLVCKRFPKDGHASTAHAHLQQKYKISVTLGGANE